MVKALINILDLIHRSSHMQRIPYVILVVSNILPKSIFTLEVQMLRERNEEEKKAKYEEFVKMDIIFIEKRTSKSFGTIFPLKIIAILY